MIAVPAPPAVTPPPAVVSAPASGSGLPSLPLVTAKASPSMPETFAMPATGSTLWASPPASQASGNQPSRGGFHIHWPPELPPLLSLEAVIGPRFGQATTYFPAFPVGPSIAGAAQPNLSSPAMGSETRNAGRFGGRAVLDLGIPVLAPKFGIDFEFLGGNSSPTLETLGAQTQADWGSGSSGTATAVSDVLPTRTLGLYASLFGISVGYRNLTWSALPDPNLTNPSANVVMLFYNLQAGLGPVTARARLGLGGGPVTGGGSTTKDIAAPEEGKASLALKLDGIELEAGVRAESLLFASDPGKLLSLFNLQSLVSSTAVGQTAVTDAQSLARFSYTWGPFVQAGVAF